jgi:hypothetical protein
MGLKSHIWKKKKHPVSSGFARVTRVMDRHAGSPGFGLAITPANLLLNPDRSSYRVDWVSGRPAGPGLITMSESIVQTLQVNQATLWGLPQVKI